VVVERFSQKKKRTESCLGSGVHLILSFQLNM